MLKSFLGTRFNGQMTPQITYFTPLFNISSPNHCILWNFNRHELSPLAFRGLRGFKWRSYEIIGSVSGTPYLSFTSIPVMVLRGFRPLAPSDNYLTL